MWKSYYEPVYLGPVHDEKLPPFGHIANVKYFRQIYQISRWSDVEEGTISRGNFRQPVSAVVGSVGFTIRIVKHSFQ